MTRTSDGGFVLVGYTDLNGNRDILVVKTNALGQTQWAWTIEGTGDDEARNVIELADGTYVVCAYTRSFPASKHSILLVKIDSSGTVAWSRSLEGENTNWPQSMIGTSDGGFLVVGDTSNALTTNNDIQVIKFGSVASIEWIGIYKSAAANDYGWAVIES